MPNWCENTLIIDDNPSARSLNSDAMTLSEIRESLSGPTNPPYFVPRQEYRIYGHNPPIDDTGHLLPGRDVPLSFHTIIPVPIEMLEQDNPNFYLDLSQLPAPVDQSTLWGTKWQPYNIEVIQEFDRLNYYFESAWSPPLAIAQAISKKHPHVYVTLKYLELGNGIGGFTTFHDGEIIDEYDCEGNFEDLRRFAIDECGYDEDFFEGRFEGWDD